MAKKEKKQLSVSQKVRRYRIIQKAAYYSEFAAIAAPYIIMGVVNFDEWFRSTEGWKVGLGGSLALSLMYICIFAITKKKEDKKSTTGGYVTLLMVWLAVAFIFMLLANLMHDIASIMFFGSMGIAAALGLEVVSKKNKEKADAYQEAIKKVRGEIIEDEVRTQTLNEVLEEEEKRKVKIKIKN